MANRTTAANVVKVTGSTVDACAIEAFISAANKIITSVLSAGCPVTDNETLKEAETFLASHYLVKSGINQGKGLLKKEERFENYAVKLAVSDQQEKGVLSTNFGELANSLLEGWLVNADSKATQIKFF